MCKRCKWKIIIDHLILRPPLAPKGAPILRDAKFAITWKKVVTRLTWFFN